MVDIMGCCHSLAYLKGKLIGDPLDIEMMKEKLFEFLQYCNEITAKSNITLHKNFEEFYL